MLEEHKEELLEDINAEYKAILEKQKKDQVEIIRYLENQVSLLLRKCNDLTYRVEKLESVTYNDHQLAIEEFKSNMSQPQTPQLTSKHQVFSRNFAPSIELNNPNST